MFQKQKQPHDKGRDFSQKVQNVAKENPFKHLMNADKNQAGPAASATAQTQQGAGYFEEASVQNPTQDTQGIDTMNQQNQSQQNASQQSSQSGSGQQGRDRDSQAGAPAPAQQQQQQGRAPASQPAQANAHSSEYGVPNPKVPSGHAAAAAASLSRQSAPGQQPNPSTGYSGPYGQGPYGQQPQQSQSAASQSDARQLVIGQGISINGEIGECDHLIVEGSVEASLSGASRLDITETGAFYGSVEFEEATIAGRFEGDLTVDGRLVVRSTGVITGTIAYKELAVEAGAQISGTIKPIDDLRQSDKGKESGSQQKSGSKKKAQTQQQSEAQGGGLPFGEDSDNTQGHGKSSQEAA